MEDFDLFTNEIKFTKSIYSNLLNKYVNNIPPTPSGPNYQSSRKLYAEEYLSQNKELECAFHLSESVSASLRTLAVYRDEQLRTSGNKLQNLINYIKPLKELLNSYSSTRISIESEDKIRDFMPNDVEKTTNILSKFQIEDDIPFYKRYMRWGPDNNVKNLCKILKELPNEWTIIQLTAPYNPNENLKPLNEYQQEINSVFLTVFTNDYFDNDKVGPITIDIPANVTKEGEKPLFIELYSLLEENYRTIENAQFINKKRLVQNYWSKREDIDLRMKSVINIMDKEWMGGWSCLLTGKLSDSTLRDKIVKFVNTTISDWGFLKLTPKQKHLLYNLIDSCQTLTSQQIKSCIRKILTEHGNPEDVRKILNTEDCPNCNEEFRFLNELCLKCLSKCFQAIHHCTLVDAIKVFSQVVTQVKEKSEWAALKKAKRLPVILIVDEEGKRADVSPDKKQSTPPKDFRSAIDIAEALPAFKMLDTFPWEMLPILNNQPVTRMENIHFLYALYKIHEEDVVDGYFNAKADVGRYVINPEKNLEKMEKRMTTFVQYWCPSWLGHTGEPPTPEDYLRYLTESDVFLYCGHGDGFQLASGSRGAGVEEVVGAKGVVLLSGCGSVRLVHPPGRGPPAAAHHHLHVAGCPMVVGMLWEVTDLEVDKVVSTLVSLYVPSTAPIPWQNVGKKEWSQGCLDTSVEAKSRLVGERDLLLAISRAREASSIIMIGSSVVARGIPTRIVEDKNELILERWPGDKSVIQTMDCTKQLT